MVKEMRERWDYNRADCEKGPRGKVGLIFRLRRNGIIRLGVEKACSLFLLLFISGGHGWVTKHL